MTPIEHALTIAREHCPCTCWGTQKPPPDGSGPLRGGDHYANCPSENIPGLAEAIEAAIRAAERDARAEIKERAAQVASEEAGNADLEGGEMWIALKIARDISALPEEPPHG